MTDLERQKMKQMFELAKAIRFNHDLSGNKKVKAIVNANKELERYRIGVTQLTLPARFNMVKTPTSFPKKTEVEIEDPEAKLDSTLDSTYAPDPNHKRRSIFG